MYSKPITVAFVLSAITSVALTAPMKRNDATSNLLERSHSQQDTQTGQNYEMESIPTYQFACKGVECGGGQGPEPQMAQYGPKRNVQSLYGKRFVIDGDVYTLMYEKRAGGTSGRTSPEPAAEASGSGGGGGGGASGSGSGNTQSPGVMQQIKDTTGPKPITSNNNENTILGKDRNQAITSVATTTSAIAGLGALGVAGASLENAQHSRRAEIEDGVKLNKTDTSDTTGEPPYLYAYHLPIVVEDKPMVNKATPQRRQVQGYGPVVFIS